MSNFVRAVLTLFRGLAWPPSANTVSRHGPLLAAVLGSPVLLCIMWDCLKKEVVDLNELEWKRREVNRAAVKLREVVKGEHTKYRLQELGAGGEGTVRLSFLLNVGGYSQEALRKELESLFEAPSKRLVLVEELSADSGFVEDGLAMQRTRSTRNVLALTTERLQASLVKKGAALNALFAMFDADGDGVITREELRLGLKQCEVDVEEAELIKLLRAIDSDADGSISLQEWTNAFGPRHVTVALLPDGANLLPTDGGPVKDDFDADQIARRLKKKLTKLSEEACSGDDNDFPLLSTVEIEIVPIQTECNEIKWTEARRIYQWRQEANHKRFRDIELEEEAKFLADKELAVSAAQADADRTSGAPTTEVVDGKALLESKIAMLRAEQDSIKSLLKEAAELTWRSLAREVAESVAKMNDAYVRPRLPSCLSVLLACLPACWPSLVSLLSDQVMLAGVETTTSTNDFEMAAL